LGFMDRMATAPISWGICEVPGWGLQLPVDRVLSEMAQMGFPATELGSEGYLPSSPAELRSVLDEHGLGLLAAFVPLVVHDPAEKEETIRQANEMATLLREAGATYFNTAPVTSWDWSPRRELTESEWAHTMYMFDVIEEITDAYGLIHVLHEHIGTIVETREEIQRVVDNSRIRFVLDTAHFAVGGYDPVDFARDHPDRVGLVHVKDADLSVARRLNDGEISLMEAVQSGIFPTVGRGNLDIDLVIASLEHSGYSGWYVLEQDIAITGDEPAVGKGPIEDVQQSVDYLRGLEVRLAA
jgi:inosose dehydratase